MKTFTAIVIISLIIIFGIVRIRSLFNDHEYTITITDKDRILKSGESKYLFWGNDEKNNVLVFENTDMILRGKINSSDIQGQLKEGETYKITVIGYRFRLFSWYENIIKIEKV